MKVLLSLPTKYVGNMTIALRAIACTLEKYPDATLLIDEDFKALIELCLPQAKQVLCYPRRTLSASTPLQRVSTYLKFMRTLRATKYDHLVDLDGTVVSARLVRMARAANKVGPSFAKRPGVYHTVIEVNREVQHCFDDYAQLVATIDVDTNPEKYLPIPATPGANNILEGLGVVAEKKLACIHPSATKDYKQWQLTGFCELANWFLDRDWQVVVVGAGQGEVERVEAIEAATGGRVINAHNRLSLFELISVLQRADLFVGNDSGPMHYAAACGTHVFAIFGPTELIRWQPKVNRHTIIKGPAPCDAACQPEACLRDYQCIGSLDLQHVTAEIERTGF